MSMKTFRKGWAPFSSYPSMTAERGWSLNTFKRHHRRLSGEAIGLKIRK
jgi:hypothetical protein